MRSPFPGAGCSGVFGADRRDVVDRFLAVLERLVALLRFAAMIGSVLQYYSSFHDSTLTSQTPCQ